MLSQAQSTTKRKTEEDECLASAETEAPNCDFEENPFGLQEEANGWLQTEMVPHGEESYLLPVNQYRPLVISMSNDSAIPAAQFQKAATEFEERSSSSKKVRPVVVAMDVNDRTVRRFIDDEEGPLKRARYLFFPTLTWNGRRQGALFMTYMPGPTHGGVDAKLIHMAENWINKNSAIETVLGTGCSSGASNAVQPDHRIFPFKKYRDRNGNDIDRAHRDLPHTRMYWEVEYDRRDVVGLRQRGANLMKRSPYTRLFLGATVSQSDEVDSSYEAAIALWGKDSANDTISVLDAVSFGTKDLFEETKQDWSEHRANRLPAVGINQWRRPAHAGVTPVELVSPTPEQWLLKVPFTGLLYRVMTGKKNADADYQYIVDTLSDDLNDMDVDLLRMSYTIYTKTAAGEDEGTDIKESIFMM